MRISMLTGAAACLAAVAVCSSAAVAATIVVKPGGKYSSIGAGIAAAGGNDKVLVKAGIYRETVVIPAGKDGLKLVASGKVTIQARDTGGGGSGPGIDVEAHDVTIDGFRITNAASGLGPNEPGIGIRATTNGVTVRDCDIIGCSESAIYIDGTDATIADCRCVGNSGGVYVGNNGAVVTKVRIENDAWGKLEIEGNDARVTKCVIRRSGNEGIQIDGERPILEKNTVSGAKYTGIRSNGENSKLLDNVIEHVEGDGIVLSDHNGVISGNKITFVEGRGIVCSGNNAVIKQNVIENVSMHGIEASGDTPSIQKNTVKNCRIGGYGILVAAQFASCVVTDNKVSGCQAVGIEINSTSSTNGVIEGNHIKACNVSAGAAGLVVRGQDHDVTGNKVENCAGDGIYIDGARISVISNHVTACCRDGIDVESGIDHVVEKNTVTDCAAEGIENNSANTTVEKNTMKGNRTDLANNGTGTESKNSYKTGNWVTAPEID